MSAYIGYDNLFDTADSVTADWTEPAGFEVANCYDYKTHTAVKSDGSGTKTITADMGSGNTATVDYLAFVGHNLDTTATQIQLLYSSDDITYTSFATVGAASCTPVFFGAVAASQTARYWQIKIAGATSSTFLSHFACGEYLQCRPIGAGFQPPVYEHYQSINAQGQAANYLGRSIKRVPQNLKIKQQGIDPADFRTDWVPFLEHAARKPFFFSWDYVIGGAGSDNRDEAVYCWTDKPQQPSYPQLCHMAIDLSVKAVKA